MVAPASLNKKLVGIGISRPYASQIATGARQPSVSLSIRIYRELGLKLGPLTNATGAEINALERLAAKRLPKTEGSQ